MEDLSLPAVIASRVNERLHRMSSYGKYLENVNDGLWFRYDDVNRVVFDVCDEVLTKPKEPDEHEDTCLCDDCVTMGRFGELRYRNGKIIVPNSAQSWRTNKHE